MSSFTPPSYNSDKFNSELFTKLTDGLSLANADQRYIRINGSGFLSTLTVSGNASIGGTLSIGGSVVNLSLLTGAVAGVSTASKVLSLNASSYLDKLTLDPAGIGLDTPTLKFSGTTFDQTMYLGITKGGALASKAMVLNSTLDYSGVNSFGCATLSASTSLSSPSITTNSITFSAGSKFIRDVSSIDFNTDSDLYKTIIRKSTITDSKGIEFYDTQFSTPTNKPLINFKTGNNSTPIFFRMCGYLNDNSSVVANGMPFDISYNGDLSYTAGLRISAINPTQATGSNYNIVLAARNGTIPHVVVNDQKNQLHLWPQGNAEINTSYAQNVIIGQHALFRKGIQVGTSQDTSRMISCLDSSMTGGTSRYITLGYDTTSKNQAEISFYYNGYGDNGNRIDFGFYGGALMYLMASGRLGIGTSSPRAPLEVSGTNTSYTVSSFSTNSYSYDVSSNSWANRGGGPFTLTNINAWFNGNIYVSTGLWTTSDRRLKENIKSINMDIERYKMLNPVSYTYKNDSKTKLGLVAQEVMKVCGEAIGMVPNENLKEEDDDSPEGVQLSLDYNAITILNVDIIKKLINRVEQLEALVETLQVSSRSSQELLEKLIARPVVAKWLAKSSL
jgi:hypothetical protein